MQYSPFIYTKYYSLYKTNWRFVVFRKNAKCSLSNMISFLFFVFCFLFFSIHRAQLAFIFVSAVGYADGIPNRNVRFRIRDNIIINFNADNKLL